MNGAWRHPDRRGAAFREPLRWTRRCTHDVLHPNCVVSCGSLERVAGSETRNLARRGRVFGASRLWHTNLGAPSRRSGTRLTLHAECNAPPPGLRYSGGCDRTHEMSWSTAQIGGKPIRVPQPGTICSTPGVRLALRDFDTRGGGVVGIACLSSNRFRTRRADRCDRTLSRPHSRLTKRKRF